MQYTMIPRNRYSQRRFRHALRDLMEERRLSYRQLAYKTKLSAGYLNHLTKGTRPVPSDDVIQTLANALLVRPDYFLEYRLRKVTEVLDEEPLLTDTLYAILVQHQPVPSDLADLLQSPLRRTDLLPTAAAGS